MRIKGLQLLSDDLEGTASFYFGVLGLAILHQSDEELQLAAGETVLSFHRSQGQKPQYHFAFNIPCNKIEEALAWMQGKAPILEMEPGQAIADFSNWNAKAFYFADNNENVVEFIARNDLQNASSAPFDASSLLSVSEVGIVSDDVAGQCAQLMEQYGIGYFPKQPPSSRFAVLGDDQGLFIVVPHSREWYPTKVLSTKHWLRVDFEAAGRGAILELYSRP
ncbi:MAG TPA: hypothetical protein VGE66_08255 [Chitinophagaceae bacterium]